MFIEKAAPSRRQLLQQCPIAKCVNSSTYPVAGSHMGNVQGSPPLKHLEAFGIIMVRRCGKLLTAARLTMRASNQQPISWPDSGLAGQQAASSPPIFTNSNKTSRLVWCKTSHHCRNAHDCKSSHCCKTKTSLFQKFWQTQNFQLVHYNRKVFHYYIKSRHCYTNSYYCKYSHSYKNFHHCRQSNHCKNLTMAELLAIAEILTNAEAPTMGKSAFAIAAHSHYCKYYHCCNKF